MEANGLVQSLSFNSSLQQFLGPQRNLDSQLRDSLVCSVCSVTQILSDSTDACVDDPK